MDVQHDDQHILNQIRENQSQGLQQLFEKYYHFLARTASYITQDKEVAEDLSQEVFVKIWEGRYTLGQVENVKAYLTRMVKNSALDHIKAVRSTSSKLAQFLYFEDHITEPAEPQTEDLKREIASALSKLPPKCRLIFSMNRFEGLTNEEIASYFDISKRTVETQVSKALKLLRSELKHLWNQYLLTIIP